MTWKILDNMAIQHRKWEALSTAIVVLGVLAWGGYRLRSARSVDTTFESATVTEIIKLGAESPFYRGRFVLADSTTVEMLLPNPIPRVGDSVPLRVEHLANDSRSYSVDVVKWQTGETE